jgi:hypothetical protein
MVLSLIERQDGGHEGEVLKQESHLTLADGLAGWLRGTYAVRNKLCVGGGTVLNHILGMMATASLSTGWIGQHKGPSKSNPGTVVGDKQGSGKVWTVWCTFVSAARQRQRRRRRQSGETNTQARLLASYFAIVFHDKDSAVR